jgi:hypothetical protein
MRYRQMFPSYQGERYGVARIGEHRGYTSFCDLKGGAVGGLAGFRLVSSAMANQLQERLRWMRRNLRN